MTNETMIETPEAAITEVNEVVAVDTTEAAEATTGPDVQKYLSIVKEDKLEEARDYLVSFFGEGEATDMEGLKAFYDKVTEVASAELEEAKHETKVQEITSEG